MRISVSANGLQGATGRGGVLAIPLAAEKRQSTYITEIDRRSGGQLSALRAVGEGSAARFHFSASPAGTLPAEQIRFAGLGGAESLDRQAIVRWAAAVTRKLAGRNVRRLVIDAAPIVAALDGASPALRANGGASFGEGISASSTLKLDAAVLAVELRDAELVSPALADLLREHGARYALGLHDRMPPIDGQLPMLRALWPGDLVCRWNLQRGQRYAEARDAWAPFDRLRAPDPATRGTLARVVRATLDAGHRAFVTINNKAEGSAPASVRELATCLLEDTPAPAGDVKRA